jgi:hypothetical protein
MRPMVEPTMHRSQASGPLSTLPPEVVARIDQTLRSRPLEDLPSGYAQPLYEMLISHGFDRADLLALAASLVDLVTTDVVCPARKDG